MPSAKIILAMVTKLDTFLNSAAPLLSTETGLETRSKLGGHPLKMCSMQTQL